MAAVSTARGVVADASVVIAFFDADDAHHDDAVALLAPVAERRDLILMHRLNLAEVLIGPISAGRGTEVFGAVAELGIIADSELDDPFELARIRASTGLKMPDACAVLAARRHRIDLLTFDDRLRRAAR